MEMKFYKCKICGKVIAMLKDTGVDTICCGSEMVEIKASTIYIVLVKQRLKNTFQL